jgi:hypothetical protein
VPRLGKVLLSSVVALCLLGPSILTQSLHSQERNTLAEHLWQIAQKEFGSTPITDAATAACKKFIANGASKVTDEVDAERKIKKLADEMVKQASFDEATGSRHIDLAAFNRATKLVCPLYPFC